MNVLNTIRTRKLLSSSLILFTLSIGIMIGTLINTGVKAAKDNVDVVLGNAPPAAERR